MQVFHNSLSKLGSAIMLGIAAIPAHAQENAATPVPASPAASAAPTTPTPPMPEPIANLIKDGAQVRYLGEDYGVQSWLTVKNGQEQYFYVLPGGKAFVMGVLFDDKGRLVTVDQLRRLQASGDTLINSLAQAAAPIDAARKDAAKAPDAALSASDQMWADISGANWITLGQADAPVIYAFIDPQCPHCHDFVQEVRQGGYLDKGAVQLRILPVGFNDKTLAQAAFLIAAPDPAARFLRHLDGDKDALPIKPDITTDGALHNVAVMQAWKLDATPFVIYRSKSKQVKIIRGKPQDIAGLVADLPMPAKPLATPEAATAPPGAPVGPAKTQ